MHHCTKKSHQNSTFLSPRFGPPDTYALCYNQTAQMYNLSKFGAQTAATMQLTVTLQVMT